VHDFDGDGLSEMAVSSASHYSVVEPSNLALVWSANVQDASGWSSGTAFDFLGDGSAEAMYTDEVALFVFDDNGQTILNVPRSSPTLIEYPIVVDVDNDGSAYVTTEGRERAEKLAEALAVRAQAVQVAARTLEAA
jgi:hypothetical protein